MRRTFGLVVLVASPMVFTAADAAKASWKSSILMAPNQGYCKDGRQHADVSQCRESRKSGEAGNRKRKQYSPVGLQGADD